MAPLMRTLREQTGPDHARIETVPFMRALDEGTLGRASYVGWLRVLHGLHETIEGHCARSEDPCVRAVFGGGRGRLALLGRDLAYFEGQPVDDAKRARLLGIVTAQELRHLALREPSALLGALYVLEGSALGGQVLRARVKRTFGLEGEDGLRYLTGSGPDTAAEFRAFAARMDGEVTGEARERAVVAGARLLFHQLGKVLDALHPLVDEPLSGLVGALNPEAGCHPITEDLREVEIALHAGEASWLAFPYYEARYGARGRRFTRSDSAWLVTLCHLDAPELGRQVSWLGRVLAGRGMPRLMLEEHLLRLHDTLCDAMPARRARYAPLAEAHALLRNARRARVPDASSQRIVSRFDPELGAHVGITRLGELLCAAVADEADGVPDAVASLCGWLKARSESGPGLAWALDGALEAARSAVREHAAAASLGPA